MVIGIPPGINIQYKHLITVKSIMISSQITMLTSRSQANSRKQYKKVDESSTAKVVTIISI